MTTPSVAQDFGELQDAELAAEFSGILCELGGAISVIAKSEAASQRQERGGRKPEDWAQAIGHIDVMLSNEAREVQCSGSSALAVLGEISSEAKDIICNSAGIIQKLVQVMSSGGLDAIGALAVITKDHAGACKQAREAGAISVLAAFVMNSEQRISDESSAGKSSTPINAAMSLGAGAGADTLSLLPSNVCQEPGSSLSHATLMNVPLASKAEVVTTLRNIATAGKENRAAISREKVTPQLVRLMTEKHTTDEKHASAADRVKHAEDARKLAKSAGQLLYTLIIEGSKEVKDLIIGAISACRTPFQC